MTRVRFICPQPMQDHSTHAAVYWREGDSTHVEYSLEGVEGELIKVDAIGSDWPVAVVLLRCDSEWYVMVNGIRRVTSLTVPLHNIARATA